MNKFFGLLAAFMIMLICMHSVHADDSVSMIEDIKEILVTQDLSEDYIHLADAESGFKTDARSKKGAVGVWQLMPATARRFGLVVNKSVDDRLDYVKSTYAASQYLKHLEQMFDGDFRWTVAAYNAGGHNIRKYYQKGVKTSVLKYDYPAAYNLSVVVWRKAQQAKQ